MLGKTLAHYEIISLLGKGGMGEVYRARDTKLQRDVAIKVLPPQMTRDPERVARFRREARTLASLTHANVAGLYGFEDIDGHLFLVMELVEGESLEQMMAGGALPLSETLNIARQIADGLEEAHENGIVHRDLKPANIMLTADGRAKILDFGLARAYQGEGVSESVPDMSPTITAAMTQAGTILGTAAYMSPEQARGKGVDRRSDLWAFGVVMWEMLSGQRLFLGETISDTLAAILRAEPDWDQLPDDTPEGVKRLIARCLERDPRRRLRDIGEARVRLERWDHDPTTMHGPTTGEISFVQDNSQRRWLPWAITALALTAAAFFGWQSQQAGPTVSPPVALDVDLHLPGQPAPVVNTGMMTTLGPDGDRVVYRGEDNFLYAKSFSERKVRRLEGTEGAFSLAFSPDGQWIAFSTSSYIRRVPFAGGSPIDIVDVNNARGMAWINNTSLVYTRNYHAGLSVISLTDNSTRELTQLDDTTNERTHRWPRVLPDGQHVLFQVQYLGRSYEQSNIEVVNLQTNERQIVYRGGSYPRYAESGHLIFARERTLLGIRFDLGTLTTSGLAVPVLEDVRTFLTDQQNDDGSAHYDIAPDGTLIYAPAGEQGIARLLMLDMVTGTESELGEPGEYRNPKLSPDGRSLAIISSQSGANTLQIIDTESGMSTPHGVVGTTGYMGAWSPDSQDLFWSYTDTEGKYFIAKQRADRADKISILYGEGNYIVPSSVSPDGSHLLVSAFRDSTFWDLLEIELATGTVRVLLGSVDNELGLDYSPDGKWIAYRHQVPGQTMTLRIADTANPQRSIPLVDDVTIAISGTWAPNSDAFLVRHEGSFKKYPLRIEDTRLRAPSPFLVQSDNYIPAYDFPTTDIQEDLLRALVMRPLASADQLSSVGYNILVTDWFADLNRMVPSETP